MSQVWELLKKNIYFLISFLLGFHIFSVHHHINSVIWIFTITFVMFSLTNTNLNMFNDFLYPLLLQWQLIKFLFQLVLFNGDPADATLQFFDWIKTFIPDFNKCRRCCFKIVFRCPVFIAFAWLYFLTIFNINNISKFFIFIQYSILNSFL